MRVVNSKTCTISQVPVWPSLLPDESLWSYRRRVIALNMLRPTEALIYFGGSFVSLDAPVLFPSQLRLLASRAPHLLSSAESVAASGTVLPLLRWCLPPAHMTRVLTNLDLGRHQDSSIGANGQGERYPRHCPECASEDEAKFGIAYWRTLFQLDFLAVCPVHNADLVGGCGRCTARDFRIGRWHLPATTCACGRPQVSVIPKGDERHRNLYLRLARTAHSMLLESPGQDILEMRRMAFAQGMLANKFCRSVRPSVARLLDDLQRSGTIDAVRAICSRQLSAARLIDVVHGDGSWWIAATVVLVDRLFGSLESFRAACAEASMPEPQDSEVVVRTAVNIEQLRSELLSTLAAMPGASRSDLRRRKSALVRALFENDRAWVEGIVPGRGLADSNARLRGVARRCNALDVHVAEWIRSRPGVIASLGGMPVHLKSETLLSGSGFKRPMRFLGPLARAAMEQTTEQLQDYKVRCVNWALANPSAFKNQLVQREYIAQRLSGKCTLRRASEIMATGKNVTSDHLTGGSPLDSMHTVDSAVSGLIHDRAID